MDFGSAGAGERNGDVPDAAGTAMDQHLLALLHRGVIDQRLPCGDEGKGQCGRLCHRQLARFLCEQPGVDGGEFSQRALNGADPARHAEYLVTGPEFVDFVADRYDHTGHVDAEHRRRSGLGVRRLPSSDLGVERIDPAGHDPHQHLARSD
jgi:hypothetical protein